MLIDADHSAFSGNKLQHSTVQLIIAGITVVLTVLLVVGSMFGIVMLCLQNYNDNLSSIRQSLDNLNNNFITHVQLLDSHQSKPTSVEGGKVQNEQQQ